MLDAYLNQTAQLYRRTDYNDNGEPTYFDPFPIRVRLENTEKLIQHEDGSVTVASSRVFSKSLIRKGDKINSMVVQMVVDLTGLGGQVEGYEVYL